MNAELDFLSEWIPEQMPRARYSCWKTPARLARRRTLLGSAVPIVWALGLVTRKQVAGLLPVICGFDQCSARFLSMTARSCRENPSKGRGDS